MLIRSLVYQTKTDLQLYQKVAEQNGFITQLQQLFTELRRYQIRSTDLIEISKGKLGETHPTLLQKTNDLSMLFEGFENKIRDKYLVSEDYFDLLAEKIPQSALLRESHIYIDGFFGFNAQEKAIVRQLLQAGTSVTLALTADPNTWDIDDPYALFRESHLTAQWIQAYAQEIGAEIEIIELKEVHRFSHPSLNHLEAHHGKYGQQRYEETPAIEVIEAVNQRIEIEAIARKIQGLVRDGGLRYRDIAVIVRNSKDYYPILDPTFRRFQIPLFSDTKKAMSHHPLMELLRASLLVIKENWSYESLFRAVKTDLLYPIANGKTSEWRERMDRLENYVLAYGIQGYQWKESYRFRYRRIRGLEFIDSPITDVERN
jgi:ATP-dependent helicase/nuclease subunit B